MSFILFVFASGIIPAASIHDSQLWTNITALGPFGDPSTRLKYWLETQQRYGKDISRLSQSLVRPGLGYQWNPSLSFWFGTAWIYTTLPFLYPSMDEARIWQQLLWINTETEPFSWLLRSRLEQRFLPDTHLAWRLRQLLKFYVAKPNTPYRLIVSDEVFFHLNSFFNQKNAGFDQNRFFIGLGVDVTPHLIAEFGYLNQRINRIQVANITVNAVSLNFYLNV